MGLRVRSPGRFFESAAKPIITKLADAVRVIGLKIDLEVSRRKAWPAGQAGTGERICQERHCHTKGERERKRE